MSDGPRETALAAEEIRLGVVRAIRELTASEPRAFDPYGEDLRAFLGSFDRVGEPRLFHVRDQPARYIAPLERKGKIGALVPCDPFTGEILAWPGWLPGLEPPFLSTEAELLDLVRTADPRVAEVLPADIDRANRFAVTPAHLERARLIEGWDLLPFKNQEERWSWVEQVRASGRMRTAWRYSAGVQYPAYKCLSYASSTVVDWWGAMHGKPPTGRYQNLVNGLQEYGLNPRELEVLYHHRARRDPVHYSRLPPAEKTLDPVTRERIPTSLRGYARLLTTPVEEELADPLYRNSAPVYSYWPEKYHMDGPFETLFTRNRHDERAIVEALDRHGIVLGMTQKRLFGVVPVGLHAIPIVGHFERDGSTVFVYHESYGNKAAGYLWDNSGGPGLMSIPSKLLRGAVVFPHRLWLDLDGGSLVVRHSEGGRLDCDVAAHRDGRLLELEPDGSGGRRVSWPLAGAVDIAFSRHHWRAPGGGDFNARVRWPGSVRGAPLAIARWALLTDQLENHRPVYTPQWITEGLSSSTEEVTRWVARLGSTGAARRLQPYRELFLTGLSRLRRGRLLAAFPALAGR
ncbi:MAG: hypothetical protein HY816_01995 [Candidatus Wallbacteria bacterium]|nr:hypothetical protein [Candidatus Wallbacteria bacterium]